MKITEKLWNGDRNADYISEEKPEIRAGCEQGWLWVADLHHGTVEDAEALAECISRAVAFKKAMEP